jgi:hypothetical protein
MPRDLRVGSRLGRTTHFGYTTPLLIVVAYLKDLTGLTNLDLGYTDITDSGCEPLQGLTKLETLGLQGNQITDAALAHLKD